MAVEQTLISSSTRDLFLSLRRNAVAKTLLPSLSSQSLTPRTFLQFPSHPERRLLVRPVRYSMDYNERSHNHHQAVYLRPTDIQWRKELCNTVNLIGVVGAKVEIRHLPSGKAVASASLAIRKSATETSWINLTFWDELAHIASQHVEKGQQIYVSGRLISDKVESDDGKQQTYYKVVVQQLNFVERRPSSAGSFGSQSSSFMPERKYNNNVTTNNMASPSTEELWQAFFVNPTEWWDNRNNKKSPKYPDFKHKDTGEALWVEGRNNPNWVKSQLDVLDSRMGSLRNSDNNLPVRPMFVDDFLQF